MIAVEAPIHTPLPGGLLERVPVIVDPKMLYGTSVEPALCGPIHFLDEDDLCVDGGPGSAEKDLDDGFTDPITTPPFLTYRAVTCYLNGGDFESEVTTWFNDRVSHAVEAGLQRLLAPGATEVYEGTDPFAALGAMEEWLGGIGSGQIMTNRGTIPRLRSSAVVKGDFDLYTRQGTPLINASGLTLPTDTVGVMYAVGPLDLYAGDTLVTNVAVPTTNRRTVLVERTWSAVVNCGVAVALITEA